MLVSAAATPDARRIKSKHAAAPKVRDGKVADDARAMRGFSRRTLQLGDDSNSRRAAAFPKHQASLRRVEKSPFSDQPGKIGKKSAATVRDPRTSPKRDSL